MTSCPRSYVALCPCYAEVMICDCIAWQRIVPDVTPSDAGSDDPVPDDEPVALVSARGLRRTKAMSTVPPAIGRWADSEPG